MFIGSCCMTLTWGKNLGENARNESWVQLKEDTTCAALHHQSPSPCRLALVPGGWAWASALAFGTPQVDRRHDPSCAAGQDLR